MGHIVASLSVLRLLNRPRQCDHYEPDAYGGDHIDLYNA
jgi:hypothetical protein